MSDLRQAYELILDKENWVRGVWAREPSGLDDNAPHSEHGALQVRSTTGVVRGSGARYRGPDRRGEEMKALLREFESWLVWRLDSHALRLRESILGKDAALGLLMADNPGGKK